MKTPYKAWINKISDGLGYTANDIKYISKAHDRVVTIVYELNHTLLLTDFFMPEFVNEKNDYCHYGFLIVTRQNIVPITAENIEDFGI